MDQPIHDNSTGAALCCVDGARVDIPPEALGRRSALVQSMQPRPVVLAVPFTQWEVETWARFHEGAGTSFALCAAALKVADFLQDEETVTAATEQAGRRLLPLRVPTRFSRNTKTNNNTTSNHKHNYYDNNNPPKVSEEDAEILLSLQRPLAERILSVRYNVVNVWLHELPASLHLLAVRARVSPTGALNLRGFAGENLSVVAGALQQLPSPVIELQAEPEGLVAVGEFLPGLQRLTLASLGQLSRKVEIEDADACRNRVHRFCDACKQLTSLTSLGLQFYANKDLVLDDSGCKEVGAALAGISSLMHVTLERHDCYTKPGCILAALTLLPAITSLQLRRYLPNFRELEFVFRHMTQLRNLDLSDMNPIYGWEEHPNADPVFILKSISHLTQLQSFHAWGEARDDPDGDFMSPHATATLLLALPPTLTALHLADNPLLHVSGCHLAGFPHLRHLSCCNTVIPTAFISGFSMLTVLEKLSLQNCGLYAEGTVTLLKALPACITHLDLTGVSLAAATYSVLPEPAVLLNALWTYEVPIAPEVLGNTDGGDIRGNRVNGMNGVNGVNGVNGEYNSVCKDKISEIVASALASHVTCLRELRKVQVDLDWGSVGDSVKAALLSSLQQLPYLILCEHAIECLHPAAKSCASCACIQQEADMSCLMLDRTIRNCWGQFSGVE